MKKNTKFFILIILCVSFLFTTVSFSKDPSEYAFATHTVNQLGYFTSNFGQFYPNYGTFEKTLEYPINSGHIAMYRQCLMVGVPYNVISAADARHEEFDPNSGFDAGNGQIAISDDPSTWPVSGWPVKDPSGNPIFTSLQDSYCQFNDSTNWRYAVNGEPDMLLDIVVEQFIYSWNVINLNKAHLIKYIITNNSTNNIDDMYVNIYTDFDIGGISSGREWADDCVEFDKSRELVYFYDSDSWSNEWQEADPFLAGVTFLNTPNNLGITDFHWIDIMVDEVTVSDTKWDSLSYSLMRSDTTWFHNRYQRTGEFPVADYFHLGVDPPNGTHFDDPVTSRITDSTGILIGGAMVAYICNGPFNIAAGQSQEILLAVVVGDDEPDLLNVVDSVRSNFVTGLKPKIAHIVADFELKQNYPNPFNNKTIITYNLLKTSYVNLSIYNVLGEKVATLINNQENAGLKKIAWNADNYPSGIYYYQLQTNSGYSETRKMLLIK